MSEKFNPLTVEQDLYIQTQSQMGQAVFSEDISEETGDDVCKYLNIMFMLYDLETRMRINMVKKMQELLGNQFEAEYEKMRNQANAEMTADMVLLNRLLEEENSEDGEDEDDDEPGSEWLS